MAEQSKNDFEAKYRLYGDMLYKIAFLYLGNPHDAEDALQDVFIKLLYDSPAFHDEEHEKAWLIRVTQNKCRDILRSSAKRNVPLDGLIFSGGAWNGGDEKLDIVSQITALPAKYKTAVILYYYYDCSVDQISHTLKLSASAVKQRLKRARAILKTELEDYNYEK